MVAPFSSLRVAEKNGSRYLVLETTKETLQGAPGYVYDSGKKVWDAGHEAGLRLYPSRLSGPGCTPGPSFP